MDYSAYQRVLVADKDDEFLLLAKRYLDECEYLVVLATTYDEARRIVTEERIDLVILDSDLPGGSGIEMLQYLRERSLDIPVVIVAATASLELGIRCMKLGAEDYLVKPLRFPDLIRSVTKVLDERATPETVTRKTRELYRMVGGYKVIKAVSRGSMGEVLLVESEHQQPPRKRYALKVIKIDGLGSHDVNEYLERFVNEAEAASRVKHPNIVEIIDYGIAEEEVIPYIVMEYIEGKSLRRHITEDTPFSYQQKVVYLVQIAEALAAIHAQNMIHRDIKPENLIIDAKDTVKLVDFGVVSVPESQLTASGCLIGTPYYLSPESFVSSSKTDHRSDIFSLGIVAYEFLVRRLPFAGRSLGAIEQAICTQLPPAPQRVSANFPRELQDILAIMLRKDRERRYQAAAQIAADLRGYLAGLPGSRALDSDLAPSDKDWA